MSDDLIGEAFAEFESTERANYRPAPGTATVRHTVAVRRRVRLTTLSVVAVLLVAVPVAAFATRPSRNNSPPDVVGSQQPTETPGPTVASPPTEPTPPPAVPPADVRNTTINLPAFPGLESACKAKGQKTFVNGTVSPADGVTLTIGAWAPIVANLDGAPGDEQLTSIQCTTMGSVHAIQLLALTVANDGSLTPLGYVVNSPDAANLTADFGRDNVVVEGGTVRLSAYGAYQSDGWPPCDKQVRGFAWRDGAFRQVSGPTSFRVPSADFHQVDFRNTGVLMGVIHAGGSGSVTCVPLTNGSAEIKLSKDADPNAAATDYTVTIGAVSFVAADDGEATFAILKLQSSTGVAWQTLQSFQMDGPYPLGWEVLRSGVDGVTVIHKAETSGNTVKVTVSTDTGTQVRTYRPSSVNQQWERIS